MNKNRGSDWLICDLQIQTILDDRYTQLKDYFEDLKKADPTKWNDFTSKVGGETNALKFDSKEYFNDTSVPKKERVTNYVRTTFAYLETYSPHLHLIGVTDHNYYDDELLDGFYNYSSKSKCKAICGVEINIGGVHLLAFFNKPPFEKGNFSEGIKTFLSKIGIDNPKTNGVLSLATKEIRQVTDLIQKEGGLYIFPHCNSNNGLFQERGKTDRTHLSDIFNHKANIILQGNSKKSISAIQSYIQSNPTLFKSNSIYTTASDGRCLKEFGKPDEDGNYQWIKAVPSFEGLKQILFEPLTRTAIQSGRPEPKDDFCIIDYVQFQSDPIDKTFTSSEIVLNSNLNSIIGGKSSGKSLLLYFIAKTIDEKQTLEKRALSATTESYNFDKSIKDFNFKVVWKDGVEYLLKGSITAKNRLITYIPQMHINLLAEKNGKAELNELVNSFLKENTKYSTFIDDSELKIRETTLKVENGLNDYYKKKKEKEELEKKLSGFGDKSGLEKSIEQKKLDIQSLTEKSEFASEEEKLFFESLQTYSSTLQKRKERILNLEKSLVKYNEFLSNKRQQLNEEFTNASEEEIAGSLFADLAAQGYWTKFTNDDKNNIDKLLELSIENTQKKLTTIRRIFQLCLDLINQNEEALKPLNEKSSFINEISAKQKQIEEHQSIIASIDRVESVIKNLQQELTSTKETVFKNYQELFSIYSKIKDEVNKPEYSKIYPEEEVILTATLSFNTEFFNNNVLGQINKQGYLSNWVRVDKGVFDEYNSFVFNEATHYKNITDFFESIDNLNESDKRFNSGKTKESVNKELLKDYFTINFNLKQKEEDILLMSPGKKGIILLILILKLSNAKHPILIDQPEDNLDNRTIYNKLKEFIKKRKAERQIIMVTHNANLVVPTDSENIIVANQSGQDQGKDNSEFKFDYVNGGLEESFKTTGHDILRQMGIREHVCDILEGGEEAFKNRENKYGLKRKR